MNIDTLHPEYDACMIGHSLATTEKTRAVYSLTKLTGLVMIQKSVDEDGARKLIAEMIREVGPAVIFVDDPEAQPLPVQINLGELEIKTPTKHEVKIFNPADQKIATPFPGTRVPNFRRKQR